jgi:hypothetical protein
MDSILSRPQTRPTRGQKLAMEKMLNSLLGANEFYRICSGIEIGAVDGDILRIFTTEACADDRLAIWTILPSQPSMRSGGPFGW